MDSPADASLLLTRDRALDDELTRLAAAAGAALDVVTTAQAALQRWARAPVVLVGTDVVAELALLAPGRRGAVHVVGWSSPPAEVFREALAVAAESVLELPTAAGRVAELLSDLGDALADDALVVGVVAGSGGAGATTFACALGQVASRGGPAVVVDLDPWGPGADRVLGLDRAPGVRWDDLALTSGRLSGRSLREALPGRDALRVLTWTSPSSVALAAAVVREALSAARRGHRAVVVDLPRSDDPVVADAFSRCSVVLLVVQPTVTGVAAATRAVARAPDPDRLRLVVRGSGVDPARLASVVGVPVAAVMADQRGLAEALDLGLGPVRSRRGPLARACREVLAA